MHNHILSIILFTPLAGALLLIFVPKEQKDAIRWIGNIFALAGLLVSIPLVPWFWAQRFEPGFKFMEGTPNNWIPSIGAGCVLGSHAGSHVPTDRHLGRPAKTLRRHQVFPLHIVRFGADASFCAVSLFLQLSSDRAVHVQHPGFVQDSAARLPRSSLWLDLCHLPLSGLLSGVCHQGADVSVPYLAAGCPRGGPDGWVRHSGWGFAENGNVRFRPLRPAFLSGCGHASQGPGLDDFPFHCRDYLRRAGFAHAEGHEEAGGVLVGEPSRFLHFGHLRVESGRPERIGVAADQSWDIDGSAVLDCRHSLRAAAHA